MTEKIKNYTWMFPVDLPGGKFCVVIAHVPLNAVGTHENGVPKRKFWQSTRLFKLKRNADKYFEKIYAEQRNFNHNQTLIEKGLFSLN